jgi:hypothetical protein
MLTDLQFTGLVSSPPQKKKKWLASLLKPMQSVWTVYAGCTTSTSLATVGLFGRTSQSASLPAFDQAVLKGQL